MKDETTSNYVWHKNYGIGVIQNESKDPNGIVQYHIDFWDHKKWCFSKDFELLPVEERDEC